MATNFIEQKCLVTRSSPNFCVKYVIEKVMAYQFLDTPYEKVERLLTSSIEDPAAVENIMETIKECIAVETMKNVQASATFVEAAPAPVVCKKRKRVPAARPTQIASATTTKKPYVVGQETLQDKESVSSKLGLERLDLIKSIASKVPTAISILDTSSQNFVKRTIRPLMNCLENHFGNDSNAFLAAAGGERFSYARFNEKCGKGGCKLKK